MGDDRIDVHEDGSGTYICGDRTGDRFILHDYQTRTYLELMVVGSHFHIRDEAQGHIYEGHVEDTESSIYDYTTTTHHRYSFNWSA